MSRHAHPSLDLRAGFGELSRQQAIVVADRLRRRFDRFRRKNPRNTRVPRDLQAAVVAAIARGVPAGLLRRACGLSGRQIKRWRMGSAARVAIPVFPPTLSPTTATKTLPARIFSVTDDATARPSDLSRLPPAGALELRLGPWSVCVRLAAPLDLARG